MTCPGKTCRLPRTILARIVMKKLIAFLFLPLAALMFGLAAGGTASAQITAADDASAYGGGWGTGTNLCFGFYPWALTNNNGAGGGFAGAFIGNSGTSIDTSFDSFGMYANQGTAEEFSMAYRSFSNVLASGSVFKVKLANTSIATGGYMGVMVRSSTNLSSLTNENLLLDPDTAFAFYFVGGQNDYFIWD